MAKTTLKEKIIDFAAKHGQIRSCDICTYFHVKPGIANATLNYLREKELMRSIKPEKQGQTSPVWVLVPQVDASMWYIPDTTGIDLEVRARYY